MSNYFAPVVSTKADVEKKVEIEAINLMYFNYMGKEEAFKEARLYVESKYKDVVEKLRHSKQY